MRAGSATVRRQVAGFQAAAAALSSQTAALAAAGCLPATHSSTWWDVFPRPNPSQICQGVALQAAAAAPLSSNPAGMSSVAGCGPGSSADSCGQASEPIPSGARGSEGEAAALQEVSIAAVPDFWGRAAPRGQRGTLHGLCSSVLLRRGNSLELTSRGLAGMAVGVAEFGSDLASCSTVTGSSKLISGGGNSWGRRLRRSRSSPALCNALAKTSGAQQLGCRGLAGMAGSAGGAGEAKRRIAVAVSGGVDSAVAAMLLKRQGHDVVGVFMRNWDESEERGNANCSVEADLRDAERVCRQLGIPLHEADFVSTYWTEVFQEFIGQCSRGLTPNPDLACNRHIKFDALLRFASGSLGAEILATGHYARLREAPAGGGMQLLRGVDHSKDQSYFLASVRREALEHAAFPLGELTKARVRVIAAEAGLAPAAKKSSAGICFIGKRRFGDFIAEYADPLPGRFVDIRSGADLGPCPNLAALTHGQRAPIGGMPSRMYVVGKDIPARLVHVVEGGDHPSLFATTARLRAPHWLTPEPPAALQIPSGGVCQGFPGGVLSCGYKARYGQPVKPCRVVLAGAAGEEVGKAGDGEESSRALFEPSKYCRLLPEDMALGLAPELEVVFEAPAHAITPQQQLVLYDGDVVLGCAPIAHPGPSLHELGSEFESPEAPQAATA